jgi:hypothetical protein
VHTIDVEIAAVGMTFLTLASSLALLPAPTSARTPAKYLSSVTRFGSPRVRVGEVKGWDEYGADLGVWTGECERVWREWRKRAKEGWIGEEGELENESGVRTVQG